jgi:hypothetical protein
VTPRPEPEDCWQRISPLTGDKAWRDSLAAVLEEQPAEGTLRILVVDADCLVACAVGQSKPGSHLLSGRSWQVIGMVADPAYCRRGWCRAIMTGLLDWFGERDLARVGLGGFAETEALYRDLGLLTSLTRCCTGGRERLACLSGGLRSLPRSTSSNRAADGAVVSEAQRPVLSNPDTRMPTPSPHASCDGPYVLPRVNMPA